MGITIVSKKIDLLKKDFNNEKLFPVNSLLSAFAIFLFNENRIIEMNTINGKYKLANDFHFFITPLINVFSKIFILFDARLNPNQFEMTKVDAITNA